MSSGIYALFEFQAKADVDGSGGMGDGAAGDEVGTSFGVGANGSQVDVAGEFHSGAAVDVQDPFGGFSGRQVVEQ